jgi:hypothetical protein
VTEQEPFAVRDKDAATRRLWAHGRVTPPLTPP